MLPQVLDLPWSDCFDPTYSQSHQRKELSIDVSNVADDFVKRKNVSFVGDVRFKFMWGQGMFLSAPALVNNRGLLLMNVNNGSMYVDRGVDWSNTRRHSTFVCKMCYPI